MVRKLIERLAQEPIALVGLAMAALQAFQEASKNQLGLEDALTAAVIAAFTWLGRELVVPMSKLRTSEYELIEELPEPYIPGPEDGE